MSKTSRSKNKPIQILENLSADPVPAEIRFYRSNEKPYGVFSNLHRRTVLFEGVVLGHHERQLSAEVVKCTANFEKIETIFSQ